MVLVYAVYIAAVVGFCAFEYMTYKQSMEYITPYQHTYETDPAPDTEPETETDTQPETAAPVMPTDFTEMASTCPPETEALTEPFPIDLNLATPEALCTLPGIGEKTALAIVAYRTQIGGFTSYEQLLDVPGIGEKTYKSILPYLYLADPVPLATEVPNAEPQQPAEPPPTEPPPTDPTEPPVIPVINLNKATKEDLMQLPECTAELAESILRLRDELGIFYNPHEIIFADGMKDELFILWMDYLAVDDNGGTQLPVPWVPGMVEQDST